MVARSEISAVYLSSLNGVSVLPRGAAGVQSHPMRAVLGLALAVASATAAVAGTVEVRVDSMRLDPVSGSPVVRLVEKRPVQGAESRDLLIWIGPLEAQAIA